MNDSRDTAELGAEFTQPPFLYEIRVKGRLSEEQWASWFDDLTISTRQGESILQGRALDHAALYGLLARLRDLAVPLVDLATGSCRTAPADAFSTAAVTAAARSRGMINPAAPKQ